MLKLDPSTPSSSRRRSRAELEADSVERGKDLVRNGSLSRVSQKEVQRKLRWLGWSVKSCITLLKTRLIVTCHLTPFQSRFVVSSEFKITGKIRRSKVC